MLGCLSAMVPPWEREVGHASFTCFAFSLSGGLESSATERCDIFTDDVSIISAFANTLSMKKVRL
jgi:hypothetical protein